MIHIDKIDLHMHTTVSDGTDTPAEILEKVRNEGLEMFAVTDHDAVKASLIIRDLLKPGDPFFLVGTEFSCRDDEGKYHILGYAFDPDSEPVQTVIRTGHGYRMKKLQARLDFLAEEFGFKLPDEEVEGLKALDNPGKPHIGNLLTRYGYTESKDIAIKKYINKLRIRNEYVRPEEAIKGILASGGIPVLAHPSYGSGDQIIVGEEMNQRLKRLIGFGLQGVEVFYSGFTAKLEREMLGFAEQYGLYATAGSDYHGSNKLIPLGDTNLPAGTEYPEGLKKFIEAVKTAPGHYAL